MSNSSDPIERAERALKKAREERETLQAVAERARLEQHQLQRRLQVAEDHNRDLQNRIAVMQARMEAAEHKAEASRRAMLEHAGRT